MFMGNDLNTEYIQLVDTVSNFLLDKRLFSTTGETNGECAIRLVGLFKSYLSGLADKLGWLLADPVYAFKIVEFGLLGINDSAFILLWENYYAKGKSQKDVASLIGYSVKNVQRIIKKLPYLITQQLIEKDLEIQDRDFVDPLTISQRRQFKLMEAYKLTRREAEILTLLWETRIHIGGKELCNKLHLSESGMKKHIRKIIRKLNVSNRQQAV
jgi:DNA-binding MarR family transcriptional regulator